jgi:hypothetical protein
LGLNSHYRTRWRFATIAAYGLTVKARRCQGVYPKQYQKQWPLRPNKEKGGLKMKSLYQQIKQIIPAQNWWAVYETADGKAMVDRLACWALCSRQGGFDFVGGMMDGRGYAISTEDISNFRFYIYAENVEEALNKGDELLQQTPLRWEKCLM